MRSRLKSAGLRDRMLVLVMIPAGIILVSFLAMMSSAALDTRARMSRAQATITTLQTLEVLDTLIHQLQKERGLSAGFVGSRGTAFREELATQRGKVDEAVVVFQETLGAVSPSALPDGMHGALEAVADQLPKRKTIRAEVDQLHAGSFFAYYSGVNAAGLRLGEQVVQDIDDPVISATGQAWASLLWIQEHAGQERGLLNGVFAAGRFPQAKVVKASGFITLQQRHRQNFHDRADDALRAEMAVIEADPTVREVMAMRQKALGGAVGEIAAADWFAAATARINLVSELAEHSNAEVQALSAELLRREQRRAACYLGLGILAVALSVMVTVTSSRTVRSVLDAIGLTGVRLQAMAAGELALEPIPDPERFSAELNALVTDVNSLVHTQQAAGALLNAVSADRLYSDEAGQVLPGALGAAYAAMLDNLRCAAQQAGAIADGNFKHPSLAQTTDGDLGTALRRMIASLSLMGAQAQAVDRGELDHPALSQAVPGDLGEAFQGMVASLTSIVERLQSDSQHLSAISEQLRQSAIQQQAGASEQAAAVAQTNAIMENLAVSATQIAETSRTVQINAALSQQTCEQTSESIQGLSEQLHGIREFSVLIRDVAGKIDLLALNASLEGVKAGEVGRGFMLVANQMQRMAEQVTGSVKNIETLIATIDDATNSSLERTREASRLAGETTDSATRIQDATIDQQTSTTETRSAVNLISGAAQTAVDSAGQMVDSANALAHLSVGIREAVSRYTHQKAA